MDGIACGQLRTLSMADELRKAKELAQTGGFMNHVLYRMCECQPGHDNPVTVAGKLELIGRAYSAAPSRGIGIDKFYAGLAEAVVNRCADLDGAIKAAQAIKQPSLDNLPIVLKAHGLLNDVVVEFITANRPEGATHSVNHRISFCSKYLHFHAPAFPIYDSIVGKGLEVRRKKGQFAFARRHRDFVGTYATFCRKLIAYADANHAENWTTRSVDAELYGYDAIDTLKI